MFDLFRSRDTAMRYLLVALLSLVALSMVITLVPGFGAPSIGSSEQAVAKVCGQEVSARMIQQVVTSQLRNQQLSSNAVELAVPQIVNQIVGEMATSCQARELGFTVSDQEVIQNIQLLMPMLFENGTFVGKDVYQAFLARNNSTIPEFEGKVRQQVLLDKLQRVAFDGVVVTPQEVEGEFRKRSEKAHLRVIKLDQADLKSTVKVSEEEIAAHYKANAKNYNTPPSMAATILVADANRMGASLPVSDEDLRREYVAQLSNFKVEERVRARHILIKAEEGAAPEVKAKAKAKAESLLKEIKAGKDFAELAKKNSEDPGSAAKGGEYDWFPRDQMVKPFSDAAFSLKAKEVSGVVETVFGYHIIQTLEKQEARTKPFEEVKDQLLTQYRQRQLFDKIPGIIEQAKVELAKDPSRTAEVAARYGLTIQKVDKWTLGGSYPGGIGRSTELDRALAPLPKGGVTNAINLPDNRMAVAVGDAVYPARPAELDEVRDRIRTLLVDQKSLAAQESRAAELETRLRESKGDIAKVAADLKYKLIDTGEFTRSGQMEGIGPAAYFGETAFINPVGHVVSRYRISSTLYFFKIESRTAGNMADLEKERTAIVSMVRERKLRERRDLFEEGLVRRLKDSGKVVINEDMVKRIATAYRENG